LSKLLTIDEIIAKSLIPRFFVTQCINLILTKLCR